MTLLRWLFPPVKDEAWTYAVAAAVGKERARLAKLELWADPVLTARIAQRGRYLRGRRAA